MLLDKCVSFQVLPSPLLKGGKMFQHVYLREGIKFGIALPSVPTCFDIYIARTLCKRGLQKGSALSRSGSAFDKLLALGGHLYFEIKQKILSKITNHACASEIADLSFNNLVVHAAYQWWGWLSRYQRAASPQAAGFITGKKNTFCTMRSSLWYSLKPKHALKAFVVRVKRTNCFWLR